MLKGQYHFIRINMISAIRFDFIWFWKYRFFNFCYSLYLVLEVKHTWVSASSDVCYTFTKAVVSTKTVNKLRLTANIILDLLAIRSSWAFIIGWERIWLCYLYLYLGIKHPTRFYIGTGLGRRNGLNIIVEVQSQFTDLSKDTFEKEQELLNKKKCFINWENSGHALKESWNT